MNSRESTRGDKHLILDSIRRIVQGLRVSSRAAERDLGLSGAQLFVLEKLENAEALSLNELAERTLTHQSSVSVVVSRLVERGLVSRSPSRDDARKLELSLTPKGRAFLHKAPPTAQERLVAAIDDLKPKSRATLAALLSEIVAGAGLSDETPELFFEGEKEGKS